MLREWASAIFYLWGEEKVSYREQLQEAFIAEGLPYG